MASEGTPCCGARRAGVRLEGGDTVRALPAAPGPAGAAVTRPREGMVRIPGGEFLMGSEDEEAWAADGEGPVRRVRLRPFYLSPTAVTNAEFEAFVRATGYVTEAERIGWSYVFRHFVRPGARVLGVAADAPWWLAVEGACWRAPEGPGSHLRKRMDHPVVHVSWNDAVAYCRWAGLRLPTEAEWERAARGGLEGCRYPWGDELTPGGRHMCNIWQGRFPDYNTAEDGYRGTAPVRAFPPNGYGLYNMSGNVWEWCADWFAPDRFAEAVQDADGTVVDPRGPSRGQAKVIRGGSYLCHRSYCNRYRVSARTCNTPDSSTGHMGFRCAADAPEGE
jgi:sulfatase modifying factor 1